MRQFWFFTADGGNRPRFPAGVVPRRASYVKSFALLGATAGHAHLKIGGYARPDARLSGEPLLHYHDLIEYGGEWYQFTTGAADHEHEIPESPSWWLVCALLRDADVAACAADADMFNIGEIVDGELDATTWDAATLEQWQARMLAGLYLAMPDVVNDNARLIAWVKNVAGLSGSERGYRCPGE